MQTMHLTLPVGAFDWEENPLSEADFQERVTTLRAVMAEKGWGAVLVFGEIYECGLLTYYSNYAPRLSPALTLIPLTGELRVLTLVGGRMVPAGKLTTWIEDVRPAGKLAESLGEWLTENASNGPLAVAGLDLMQASDYEQISNMPEVVNAEDATAPLEQLVRLKSPAEISMIKENCAILNEIVTAVTNSQNNGDSPAGSAIVVEKTARNLGAQDARCLYSADGGATFKPFQKLSDESAEPVILYAALKMRGYWADGFITTGNPSNEIANNALTAMIAAAKPGASVKALAQARDAHITDHTPHPILLGSLGSGIGVSQEETPLLTSGSSDALAEGDIISLKVGTSDDQENSSLASAILHIQSDGNEILWRSV
jgi:Xaa-Pro aminopeptidase